MFCLQYLQFIFFYRQQDHPVARRVPGGRRGQHQSCRGTAQPRTILRVSADHQHWHMQLADHQHSTDGVSSVSLKVFQCIVQSKIYMFGKTYILWAFISERKRLLVHSFVYAWLKDDYFQKFPHKTK